MASPKVTLHHDTPETKAVADKNGTVVTDALGRSLKVKKTSALGRYDLAKIVGADQTSNPGVMGVAALAFSVIEIDGERVPQPTSELELRALIGRLDDEGLEAVIECYISSGWGDSTVDKGAVKN